ncbi:GIN domain-containing protein [Pedobacter sp. KLB.chiD]|uniref:GIN domain-containing protein n=1 Tax=Pedobacter sp. KLB.chiD TaxID=3387402 RepID=UPI00399C100E
MKTTIKTLLTTSLTAIVLSSAVFTTNVSAKEKEPDANIKLSDFKRISVKGNVELTIIQQGTPGIAYNEDNEGTAKVMQNGYDLKITSTSTEKAKLTVYVTDFYRIEASENAIIRTEGKLNTKYFQIFLKGNAHADINTISEGLYTVISDHADLKLSGSTDIHTLIMGKSQKLTIDKFAALKTDISSIETIAVGEELAAIK